MVCSECGLEFHQHKLDSFSEGDQSWCSEVCGRDAGWHDSGDLRWITEEVVRALEWAATSVPPDHRLSRLDRQFVNDALAIVLGESGADRRDGPPATVGMLRDALETLRPYAFWPKTIAQPCATLTVLQDCVGHTVVPPVFDGFRGRFLQTVSEKEEF